MYRDSTFHDSEAAAIGAHQARHADAERISEAWGERAMDRLDRRFMRGEIGQAEYDAAVRAIGSEVSRRYDATLEALRG